MGVLPSDLYEIEWPLARFYFNRGIYKWGKFVENRLEEVEATVRNQMKNRRGTETFVTSQRIAAFNKIFGLSVASAYRQPDIVQPIEKKAKTPVSQPNSRMFTG